MRLALLGWRGKRAQSSSVTEAMIPDRVFYPLAFLFAAALVALALVWPQGQGAPSPGAFAKPPALRGTQP
jgi:hypothetical protein